MWNSSDYGLDPAVPMQLSMTVKECVCEVFAELGAMTLSYWNYQRVTKLCSLGVQDQPQYQTTCGLPQSRAKTSL